MKENKIVLGWHEFGELSKVEPTREGFKEKFIKTYPMAKKGSIVTSSGMLYRFIHEVKVGDYIVFPSNSDRMINLGVVKGEHIYSPENYEYVYTRYKDIA